MLLEDKSEERKETSVDYKRIRNKRKRIKQILIVELDVSNSKIRKVSKELRIERTNTIILLIIEKLEEKIKLRRKKLELNIRSTMLSNKSHKLAIILLTVSKVE